MVDLLDPNVKRDWDLLAQADHFVRLGLEARQLKMWELADACLKLASDLIMVGTNAQ